MPRATFMQSVLRKPTRSYANPSSASPWAMDDDDDASLSSRGYAFSDTGRGQSELGLGEGSRFRRQTGYDQGQYYDDRQGYGHDRAGPSKSTRYRPPPQALSDLRHQEQESGLEEQRYRTDSIRSSASVATARKPRKAKSVVSPPPAEPTVAYAPSTPEKLSTQFPRARPKSRSTVGVVETENGPVLMENGSALGTQGMPKGPVTVKRKKKPKAQNQGVSEAAQIANDSRAREDLGGSVGYTVTTIKSTRQRPRSEMGKSSAPPVAAARRPPMPERESSHTVIPPPPIAPLPAVAILPPHLNASASVSSSSAHSSRDRVPQTPPDLPSPAPAVRVPIIEAEAEEADRLEAIRPRTTAMQRSNSTKTARNRVSIASTDGGDTVYWTPPTSPGDGVEDEDNDAAERAERSGGRVQQVQVEVTGEDDPETPAANEPGPPLLTIQPPTPAPVPDTSDSVFDTPILPTPTPHGQVPTASSTSHAVTRITGVPERALSITRPALPKTGSAPPILSPSPPRDDDAQSLHAHTGSDDEHLSPTPPDAEPLSAAQLVRPPSRPSSITHSAPLPARSGRSPATSQVGSVTHRTHSRHGSRAGSLIDPSTRRESVPNLSASVARALRPHREGSIRSSVSAASGFGKGGWAAAAASGSQSGRNSPSPQPTMYMPTGNMSGWDTFHLPPPPRQTKYTPLPAASQPRTFDEIVHGDSRASSRGGSMASWERNTPANGHVPTEAEQDTKQPEHLAIPSSNGAAGRAVGDMASHSSGSVYSDEETSDDEGERPSRTYAGLATGPLGPPISTSHASPDGSRRESFASSVPPIPPKDPRRPSLSSPYTTTRPYIPAPEPSESQYSYEYASESGLGTSPLPVSNGQIPDVARPTSPAFSEYSDQEFADRELPSRPLSPSGSARFPRPSFLDPDVLTVLPEMSVEDSNNLYRSPTPSEAGRRSWRGPNGYDSSHGNPYDDGESRPASRAPSRTGSHRRAKSETGEADLKRPVSILLSARKANTEAVEDDNVSQRSGLRKAKSSIGFGRKKEKSVHFEGSSIGEGVLMQSDGKEPERLNGYTSLVLPSGAYTPVDPNRQRSSNLDHRILGMPSTSMAALTLSSSASKLHLTPAHLRHSIPLPVDFSSHLPPPTKVGSSQVLVQVYATGIDKIDAKALEEKGKGDVGKWVPGRSFVGRVVTTGKDEREVVRGELVVGLVDVRKSGALAEYIVLERRRLTRAPHPTQLSLEQLALLPLHGVPTIRALRSLCFPPRLAGHRALIHDAHHGIPALLCQDLSRRGVHVTALIAGGDGSHEAQTKCMAHGARGVLTGSPAAVMFGLEENGWDIVVDTTGGERVVEACKRILRQGGKLISTVKASPSLPASAQTTSKPSGFKTLRAAFAPKATRRDSKHIDFEYIPPAGNGEPEVDARGMDVRDVLEDDLVKTLRPAWEGDKVWPLEQGMHVFEASKGAGVGVVRLIN